MASGINECKFEYIARLDSDDYSCPTRIEEEFAMFDKYPKLGLVGSNVNEFIDDINNIVDYIKLPEKQEEIYKFSKTRNPFRHPALLYKKSEVLKAGKIIGTFIYVKIMTYLLEC